MPLMPGALLPAKSLVMVMVVLFMLIIASSGNASYVDSSDLRRVPLPSFTMYSA